MGGMIVTKRIYEKPAKDDGYRVLVDRLWPRGVKKEEAELDAWEKELAPSNELRKAFGHEHEKWAEFKKAYAAELKDKRDGLKALKEKSRGGRLTLLFAAKDEERNNAVALKGILETLR